MRSVVFTLFVFGLLCVSAKDRNRQTGRVLDTERNRYFRGFVGSSNESGTVGQNGAYSGTSSSDSVAIYRTYQTYVIEADTYVYQVEERLKWRWSKPANVTVNAPVQFAVDKGKVWLLDDDGKEHETKIVKRVLKEPGGTEK